MKCPKCSRELPDDASFCCYCGYKLHRDKKKTRTANGTGYVFKRGKTWTVRVTVGWKDLEEGKKTPIQKYKGGFATKAEAIKYVGTLKNPASVVTEMPTYETVYNEWYKHWTTTRKIVENTARGYRTAYSHLGPIKNMRIDKITPAMIQNILNEASSHSSRKGIKSVLKLTFEYAMDEYNLKKTPAHNLYLGKNDSKQRPPLTEEELEIIKSHFDDEPYAKYVYCMSYLGFRPTAFLSLKKSDYHDENGVQWLVGGIKTDAGIDRDVTIPKVILPLIKERLAVEGTELLFPRYDRDTNGVVISGKYSLMTAAYFSKHVFKPLVKRLNIPDDRVPYSTRHTYANKIKRAQGADRDKADLIGHTDYDFTKKNYQTSTLEERKKITDQLE